MSDKSSVTVHFDICNELNRLYAQKNADYGDSFHQTFLEEGFAMSRIRLTDKLNRFKNLSKKKEKVGFISDESIRDTLMDLANYALMTVLEIDRTENKDGAGVVLYADGEPYLRVENSKPKE